MKEEASGDFFFSLRAFSLAASSSLSQIFCTVYALYWFAMGATLTSLVLVIVNRTFRSNMPRWQDSVRSSSVMCI
jgi:hypothetical protein